MKNKKLPINLLVVILLSGFFSPGIYALNAVASLKRVNGNVQVERGTPSKTMIGRIGLILQEKDIIVTGASSKATVLFRDGSEIRLFQKTRFTISSYKESQSDGSRLFINKLILKLGSFWGKFAKGKQRTFIETPTATAGIKGTIVSFEEKNGQFSASLAEGSVSIKNEDEEVLLTPGHMIKNVTKTGDIKDKIVNLPFQLQISPDQQKIKLPTKDESSVVYFSLQLVDVKSNRNVGKKGPIYLSVDSDRFVFPKSITLNDRGYTRVKALVKPFAKKDYRNGKVEIIAVMDGETFMDVAAGHALLTFDIPKKSRKLIKIDSQTGQIEQ